MKHAPERPGEWFDLLAHLAILLGVATLVCGLVAKCAFGAPPPDATGTYSEWFHEQRTSTGGLCCDEADGRILRLDQLRAGSDGSWEVQVPANAPADMQGMVGEWLHVPASAIINVENPVGKPVAWFYMGTIRCLVLPPLT